MMHFQDCPSESEERNWKDVVPSVPVDRKSSSLKDRVRKLRKLISVARTKCRIKTKVRNKILINSISQNNMSTKQYGLYWGKKKSAKTVVFWVCRPASSTQTAGVPNKTSAFYTRRAKCKPSIPISSNILNCSLLTQLIQSFLIN